jgi:hypothetical protein
VYKDYQNLNASYCKTFAKEIRADRDARRTACSITSSRASGESGAELKTMSKTQTHKTAPDAFIRIKAKIDENLQRLIDLSDDHFNVSPDDLDWGHVGNLAHIADLIANAASFASQ